MGIEIERKFLVIADEWRTQGQPVRCRQGYLARTQDCTVRVRVMGERGFLTVKGKTAGISRAEYEYEIPRQEAEAMLDGLVRTPQIHKSRTCVPFAGHVWEVDEFYGDNAGLIVAEIELAREDEPFQKPAWVGDEVTGDNRYANAALAQHPYCQWKNEK